MPSMDLTTLANVRTHLNLKTEFTSDDPLLQRLITSQSEWFEQQTRRKLKLQAYTDIITWNLATEYPPHHPPGVKSFPTRHYPIATITSVKIDDNVVDPQPTVIDPGWRLDTKSNSVEIYAYWQFFKNINQLGAIYYGARRVEIVYTAGYAALCTDAAFPKDVEQAVLDLIAFIYKGREHTGISQRSSNGDTTSFNPYPCPLSAQAVIDAYTRVQDIA